MAFNEKMYHRIDLKEKRQFCNRKLAKIAVIRDHDIDTN
jgi:hypothetical protein